MDMHAPLILDLPPNIRHALRAKARAAGMAPSMLAQRFLAQALFIDGETERTLQPMEEHPPLLAPLRALFAADLARAVGWDDLQTRMALHGYTFRERGGGLALYCTKTAARICKASELGWPYADLMRRFGQPFPGHSHTWLAHRVLRPASHHSKHHPDLFQDPGDEDDDDIILIEPC